MAVQDGGVDASLEIILELPGQRTAGLVNSGRTVYQFKWRADRADVRRQTGRAIADADLVLFVVDAAQGLTPADREVASSCARRAAPSERTLGSSG